MTLAVTDSNNIRVPRCRLACNEDGWIAKAETSGRRTRRLDRDLYRGGVQPDSPAHALGEGHVIGTRVRRARVMTHSRTRGAHRRTSTMAEKEIVSRVTFSSSC